jgi:hypothetical protein
MFCRLSEFCEEVAYVPSHSVRKVADKLQLIQADVKENVGNEYWQYQSQES